ncbi:MAG: FAD-dependent monooxygenase [Sphingomonas sp.]|uniref:FAD-dependent monooxygenase n=1 Tax=Sphingomonas sp. TaxID=28214 RepID=UPI0025FE9E1C|nr:FAD-dependent monooxygenase [Sphingomonas sp.]MBX3563565.1 FAD-dependent monooxygenase [Sphingomonas sp.]
MAKSALDCEVLVVGAGPTGLMAANLLKRNGIDVRLVEQRPEQTRESRAFAVQARTLELMQSIGLAARFLARGMAVDSVNMHFQGKFRGGLNFAHVRAPDTPYPYIFMIPQSETEAILTEDIEKLGVKVERGVAVDRIEQDATGVTTTVTTPAGQAKIRSAYIVGGDGSRSIVRSETGIGWEGDMVPQRFLLADCKVDWEFSHDKFRVFHNGALTGLFLPLDGSRLSRVMATDLSENAVGDAENARPAPLELEEMQAGFAKAIGVPVKLSNPEWLTRYRAHHRIAGQYRSGRAFIAGDAAHIHSPAGGQGMNTGLQDAANLAWKLAAVLRGSGSESLLDSYDAERRPLGEAVVKSTGKLFAAAAGQAGWIAALRDRMASLALPVISKLPPFHNKVFNKLSQRGIVYPRSAFVGGTDGKVKPGGRVPNAPLTGGKAVFDLIKGYRFHILVFSNAALDAAQSQALASISASREVEVHQIDSAGQNAEAFERFGVAPDEQVTLVVRPDGYVAWRGQGVLPGEAAALVESLAAKPRPARKTRRSRAA